MIETQSQPPENAWILFEQALKYADTGHVLEFEACIIEAKKLIKDRQTLAGLERAADGGRARVHRINLEKKKDLARFNRIGQIDPLANMDFVDHAVASARFLGEDISFAKEYIPDAMPLALTRLTELQRKRIPFKKLSTKSKDDFLEFYDRVRSWVEIAHDKIAPQDLDRFTVLQKQFQKKI